MSAEHFRPIIDAVAEDGFKPRLTSERLELYGEIEVCKRKVPLCLQFDDLMLVEGPRLLVPDLSMLKRKVVPHVDEDGELCAVDRQLFVFDRYSAPGLTRGLIVRAGEVLSRGMTKAGTDEIAEEFSSYWSKTSINPTPSLQDGAAPRIENGANVTTGATISFAPHQARPETLGELVDWANHWDKRLGPKIIAGLASLNANDPMVVIHAQNATIAATIRVSARGAMFQKSLARPAGWKRYIESRGALTLAIERSRYRRHDLAALLGSTSEGGRPLLAGRHVVLIGCGAIGGYLARMLAQLGAGIEGKLLLIDKDILSGDNIRRHQLGLGDVLIGKAKACAEAIRRDFPGLCIDGVSDEATRCGTMFANVDLVIDATGEQGLSHWLNDWWLERRRTSQSAPALLFVWIAGSGSAAQSFLVADEKFACYRCLQPDLQKPARFDPLKKPPPAPIQGCGDQPSTSYGPAAPSAAASLAVSQVSDWARGQFHPRLRTVRMDWEETIKRDPNSPDRATNCPACANR